MKSVPKIGPRALHLLRDIFYPHLKLLIVSDYSIEALQVSLFNKIKLLDSTSFHEESEDGQILDFLAKWQTSSSCPSFILLDNRKAFTYCRQIEMGTPFKDQEILKRLLSGTDVSLSSMVITSGSRSYVLIQGIELAFLNSLKKTGEQLGAVSPDIMTLSSFLLQRLPLPSDKSARLMLVSLRQKLLEFVAVDESGNVHYASDDRGSTKLSELAKDLSETYLGKRAADVQIFGIGKSEEDSAHSSGRFKRLPVFSFSKPGLGTRLLGAKVESWSLRKQLMEVNHYARIALSFCVLALSALILTFATTSILADARAQRTDRTYRSFAERRNLAATLDSLRRVEQDLVNSKSQLPSASALFSLFCQERFDDLILSELTALRPNVGSLAIVASGTSNSEKSVFHLQEFLNNKVAPLEFSLRTLTRTSETDNMSGARSFAFTLALVIDEDARLE